MGRSFPAQDTAHYNAIYPNQHCGTQSVMTAFLIVADLLETIEYFNSLKVYIFIFIFIPSLFCVQTFVIKTLSKVKLFS